MNKLFDSAHSAACGIFDDLITRKGFDAVIDDMDDDALDELEDRMAEIIREVMQDEREES